MAALQSLSPRTSRPDPRGARGSGIASGIAERYRALKQRLVDLVRRGDRDYAVLSALSQELGRMRQKIRAEAERRRQDRKRRKAMRSAELLPHTGGAAARRRSAPLAP